MFGMKTHDKPASDAPRLLKSSGASPAAKNMRPAPADTRPAPADTRTVTSAELFADAREVVIDHLGQIYRLRHTSNGKLILTK